MPPFVNKRSLILKVLTLLAEEEKNCRIILRGKLTKPNPNFQLNLFCFKGLYISKTIYKTRPRKTIFRVKTLKKPSLATKQFHPWCGHNFIYLRKFQKQPGFAKVREALPLSLFHNLFYFTSAQTIQWTYCYQRSLTLWIKDLSQILTFLLPILENFPWNKESNTLLQLNTLFWPIRNPNESLVPIGEAFQ